MNIRPLILSGGSGTRLRPSSRASLPKQFINFSNHENLFYKTLNRFRKLTDKNTTYKFAYEQKKNTEIEEIFDNITDNISNTIYVLHTKRYGNIVDSIIHDELNVLKNDDDILRFATVIHRKTSILLHLIRKNKNIDSQKLESIFSVLLNNQLFKFKKLPDSFQRKKNSEKDIKLLCKDALKLAKKNIQ